MRLYHSSKYELAEFIEPAIPSYAILSHTWETEEVSFQDLQSPSVHTKRGFEKLKNGCAQAQLDGIDWIWIDTCCIDKSNKEEASEATNSMYKWFEDAAVCYAYLSDVSSTKDEIQPTLRHCRWFTRKWTLQELVAPHKVVFFAHDWVRIGTRKGLHSIISEITGIQSAVLTGEKKPKQCHVSERMAWTSNRTTTRVEDDAYSMMGLFDIKMPLLYGEGSRAFRRLQEEISKTHYASVLDTARTGMRLLVTKSDPLEIKSFAATDSPEYAILSHTWGPPEEEVSFSDVLEGNADSKQSYQKVRRSCQLAASHGFEYIWIDTCCIDKTSSAELQEAICSMYRWYKNARICYVYLEDCPVLSQSPNLWECRWFTRGWTLQELIAPTFIEFYDEEWNEIGTKSSLCQHLSEVARIDPAILRGSDPTERTVAERMSWASSRSTTRIEDAAYSLMGLFNVFMPMLYGEGRRAFTRLQEEIMKTSEDYTIFSWKASFMSGNHRGLLAHSPDEFLGGASVVSRTYKAEYEPEHPPTLTSRGLLIDLPISRHLSSRKDNKYIAWVGSPKQSIYSETDSILCIWLQSIPSRRQTFVRVSPSRLEVLPNSEGHLFTRKRIYVLPFGTTSADANYEIDKTKSGMILLRHPQNFEAQLLKIPTSTLGESYPDVKYNPRRDELLYSYKKETCILAALNFKKDEEQFFALIGFHNHLPWCSVFPSKDLERSTSRGIEPPKALWEQFDKLEWLSEQTDRSSNALPNRSTIAASFRVGCPTSLNPIVYNLQIGWNKEPPFLDQSLATWQASLSASLAHLPITILNPHRSDWDFSWREELSFAPFTEQVSWELDGLEKADVIAIYFGADSKAPITLLELGLFANSEKCVMVCPEGFWKRGNMQVVCERYGIRVLDSVAGLAEAVVKKLTELGKI